MRKNWKRILAGLLAVFVIGQLAMFFLPVYEASESDSLADIESHKRRLIIVAYFWQFIAVTVGGFVARKKFVIPAVVYVAVEWVYGAVKGYMVAYNSWQEYDEFEISIDQGEVLSTVIWEVLPYLFVVLALAGVASVVGMKIFRALESQRMTA